jgi:hypothetical protein
VNRAFFAAQLPPQDGELVAQREDLGVLVPVVQRQQPQERESVGYAEVGQSKQHNRPSSRAVQRQPPAAPGPDGIKAAGEL